MVSVINTALSGLDAAQKRIQVASNNIANQSSTKTTIDGVSTNTPYTPQRVDLVTLSNAGVAASVSDIDKSSTRLAETNNPEGFIESPNIDVAQELIDIKVASYDYKANIKAIQIQGEIEDSLLDILS